MKAYIGVGYYNTVGALVQVFLQLGVGFVVMAMWAAAAEQIHGAHFHPFFLGAKGPIFKIVMIVMSVYKIIPEYDALFAVEAAVANGAIAKAAAAAAAGPSLYISVDLSVVSWSFGRSISRSAGQSV